MTDIPRPTITLSGSGETMALSNRAARFTLEQGSTGLGVAPIENTTAPLEPGGSVMRHRRRTEAQVQIPLLLGDEDYYQRRDARRLAETICTDEVDITVTHPDGEERTRTGWYAEGLEGSYGAGEDSHDGQKLVLSFLCTDPAWYGPWRQQSRKIGEAAKPFTSQGTPTGPVNQCWNPSFEGTLEGWAWSSSRCTVELAEPPVAPAAGYQAARITALSGASKYTWTRAPQIIAQPGEWVAFQCAVIGDEQTAMPYAHVRVLFYSDTGSEITDAAYTSESVPVTTDWSTITGSAQYPTGAAYASAYIYIDGDATGAVAPQAGQSMYTDMWILSTATDQATAEADVATYFDGDMDGYGWLGNPHMAPSVAFTDPSPFFPVILSESSVQGVYDIDIEGDGVVYPIWEITGPGEDALLENVDTGEALFLSGEITETVTVDTRPQVYDITSPSMPNGEWWPRAGRVVDGVLVDQDLFPLRPGVNHIRLSMVDASPDSEILLRYRETYNAGY